MFSTLRFPIVRIALMGWLLTGFALAQSQDADKDNKPKGKLYERLIYTTTPGKLPDLHARFRDHTMQLFQKHGMENLIYWNVSEGARGEEEVKDNMLVYIIAHQDEAARDASWKAFMDDPEWKKVAAKSEENGKILAKSPQSILMRETDFSGQEQISINNPDGSPRLFELRQYNDGPDGVPGTVDRFAAGEKDLFTKHGMKTVKFWTVTDNSAFIYLLAHKDREAARESWQGFFPDFRTFMTDYRARQEAKNADQAAAEAAKPKRGGGNEVRFLVPTDYSPRTAFRYRRPPIVSPDVEADGKVTFRLQVANADAVEVAGQWPDGNVAMKKGKDDIWQVTVDSVPPGVWEYSFRVDGLSMIDPMNSDIKPMRSPRTSILHVHGEPLLEFQDVPHGTVHLHTYRSKSLGRLRELAVYTPAEYPSNPEQRFPTLYLQHGSGDNQATWTVHGKAHWIVDNLIAEQRAKPMVIVMMDGHASPPSAGRGGNTEYFEKDLLEDVMPMIEANYRVMPDAADRAIVGLSMGGGQSLTIGLNHTDKFAWVGGFSSAPPRSNAVSDAMENPERTNQRLRLLWIGCGQDDFLLSRNEAFIDDLAEHGIKYEWQLTEGNHSWPVWRTYLADFVPRLFQ